MKKKNIFVALFLIFILFSQNGISQNEDSNNSDFVLQWQMVDSLARKGLPKSALEIIDKLYLKVKSENDPDQIIKTILYKMRFLASYEEEALIKNINFIESEIENSKFPVTPLLQSMLAEMYWGYYKRNRYKILQRTETVDFEQNDIRTWHAKMFVEIIINLYKISIANTIELQKLQVNIYDDILTNLMNSRNFRPTIYDFMAQRALDFFSNSEAGLTRPAEQFELYKTDIFLPAEEFVNVKYQTPDSLALKYYAVQILQDLVGFHLEDEVPDALFDVDLKRYKFARQNCVHATKDSIYLISLENLLKKYIDFSFSSWISYDIAQYYLEKARQFDRMEKNDLNIFRKKAYNFCQDAIDRFPKSFGAQNCQALQNQIKYKSLSITTENVNIPGKPFRALINYRNLNQIYLSVMKVSPEEIQAYREKIKYKNDYELWRQFYLEFPVETEWQVTLPDDGYYNSHSVEIKMPVLKLGHYVILVGTGPGFTREKEAAGIVKTWISNLGFLAKDEPESKTAYYVYNRHSGKPLKGVEALVHIDAYNRKENEKITDKIIPYQTDENGRFEIESIYEMDEDKYRINQYRIDFHYKNDRLFFDEVSHNHQAGFRKEYTQTKTVFFTDRSIYRPGQTVYFKCITFKKYKNLLEILTDYKVNVKFFDVNSQKISELDLKTNEYGTFSGSFVIPTGGLNGQMVIRHDDHGKHYGSASFSVEEYKRPKFEATFKPLKESFKLGDKVKVKGLAAAYAGSNIDNAEVKYRVVRNATFPYDWYTWRKPRHSSASVNIVSSSTRTNEKGEFEIEFKALPDLSIPKKSLPVFNYSIYADITDISGETHSAYTTLKVGYTALIAELQIPETLNQDSLYKFTIDTKNLNGEFEPAAGTITIYPLKDHGRVFRKRLWNTPDRFIMDKEEYYKDFPFDIYKDENDFKTWEKGKKVSEFSFDTSEKKTFEPEDLSNREQGKYVAELETKDKYGNEIKQVKYFTLYSLNKSLIPLNELSWQSVLKDYGEPGETAQFYWGSAANNIYALLEIFHKNKLVESRWIKRGSEKNLLKLPIEEACRGGFGFSLVYVKYGRVFSNFQKIKVPWSNKKLNISFESFRDRLKPGQQEEWKLKISGPDAEKVNGEMLASMYDASLDAFKRHKWDLNLYPGYSYLNKWHLPKNYWFGRAKSFSLKSVSLGGRDWNQHSNRIYLSYDQLDWFGYDIRSGQWYKSGLYNVKSLNNHTQGESIIKGTVRNQYSGKPLPGVNIVVEGQKLGASTDINGKYELLIPEKINSVTLHISYIGYRDMRITLGINKQLDIWLEETIIELSDAISGTADARRDAASARGQQRQQMKEAVAGSGVLGLLSASGNAELDDIVGGIGAADSEIEKMKSDMGTVQARQNLNETAFFYPHLQTNEDGEILFSFTMPEALTRWKFMALAHTPDLKYSQIQREVITQKELMILPNAPRFLRKGDEMTFSAKVSSLTDTDLSGFASLQLFDAITMHPVDTLFNNADNIQKFNLEAGQSAPLKWNISVPEDVDAVTYRVVAKTVKFSDGEENTLPVLTNRMLVTESLPLPIRGQQKKEFQFNKLIESEKSSTLKQNRLTLEFTANPAWYAIQALPYLMEYPYDCSEQIFSRFYANSIASFIANSNPKIKHVFDAWKDSDALISNLEKNQELKSILLQETPWVLQAQNESQRKKRVGLLFDLNNMSNQLQNAMQKLKQLQLGSGAWPWFKGMKESRYITRHIVCGMGHLDKLGIKNIREEQTTWNMIKRAVGFIDYKMQEDYDRLIKSKNKEHIIGRQNIHYLYARSYFMDIKVKDEHKTAFEFWKSQAKKDWLSGNIYTQGMIALALHRLGDEQTPKDIIKSLKERSLQSEEMGTYWAKNNSGYYWYQAPIETQSLLIELFDEVTGDKQIVNDMRVWLLKQKQTRDWKTTKATTEACYALLLRGTDWLSTENNVEIKLGSQIIDPSDFDDVKEEAGTGYFKVSWNKSEIKPEMGNVSVNKKDEGVSWGALYWQYFEDLDKITPHETPLKLIKQLFKEEQSKTGPVLIPVTDSTMLKPGDLIKVRIELRVDRDMEYIHMKDMRAAGLEPINVLSQYKYQGGLGYYESTKDASTNFFMSQLRKGTYVFEYPLRVTHYGDFSNGITTIQCMYAPEFTSHSGGVRLLVGEN